MNHTPVVKKYNLGRHRKHHKLQSKRLSEYKSFKIIFVVIYINKKNNSLKPRHQYYLQYLTFRTHDTLLSIIIRY